MLHELIFALNGFPGKIFIYNTESKEVKVDSNIPFIHPSEIAIINDVLHLSTNFIKLQQFSENKQDGLYVSSLQDGILDILHGYRKVLVDLESELLNDEHLTLSYIKTQLEDYQLVLFTLVEIIEEIITKKVNGGCVLTLLYDKSFSGDHLISDIILKLMKKCCQVFYSQLATWLFKGILPKHDNEFFIFYKDKLLTIDKKTEDKNKNKFSENAIQKSACLNIEKLPCFISVKIGQQILYIGESVTNFKINKTSQIEDDCLLEPMDIEGFLRELKLLSNESKFQLEKFEEFVEKIRRHIAQKFYNIIVVKHNLMRQLNLVKEFFLIGRGELYLVFINHVKALLHMPITKTTQYEVNQIFQKAAHDLFLHDQFVEHFKFVIENESSAEDSWTCLTLTYNCEWPFQTVFTQDVLNNYNQLLRFLIKIKRVELALNRTWMVSRHKVFNKNEPQSLLRNHMAFFVCNFQYYLQVDVIESQFNILTEKIRNTTDFDEILLSHDRFLASLFAQCFLNADITHKCCNEILNLCLTFCRIILNNDGVMSQPQLQQLQEIFKVFNQHTRLLLQVLSNVQQRNKHSYLSQLLLRVDFNHFFSNKNIK